MEQESNLTAAPAGPLARAKGLGRRLGAARETLQQAWFPTTLSLITLYLLAAPGIASLQVQQALWDYIAPGDGRPRWLTIVTAALAMGLLAATLAGWTTRLIEEFFDANGRARRGRFFFALGVGVTPTLGIVLNLLGLLDPTELASSQKLATVSVVAIFLAVGMAAAAGNYAILSALGRQPARNVLAFLPIAFSVVLIAIFVFDNAFSHGVARVLGPIALLGIGFSALTAVGSALIRVARSTGYPLFAGVIVWVVMLNYFDLNDGHRILGTARASHPSQFGEFNVGEPVDEFFTHWALESWESLRPKVGTRWPPVFLVSAEGGGIRAAYVTAMTLAVIADRCPLAANRIFAISGVSGGAVGAAVYVAAIKSHPLSTTDTRCNFDDTSNTYFEGRVRQALAGDHLSPLLAKLIFTESLQGVLPFAVSDFDRQRALSASLSQSFAAAFGSSLELPMLDYLPTKSSPSTPFLEVTATNVEEGRSVPIGYLTDLNGDDPADLGVFSTDYSLAEVATTSARFPFVSPPGFVAATNAKPKRRYSDGGIYDNSALTTVEQIYSNLVRVREDEESFRIGSDPIMSRDTPIIVLNITNAPSCIRVEAGDCPAPLQYSPRMHALADTVDALFAVRDRHTDLFREQFLGHLLQQSALRDIHGYVTLPGSEEPINDTSGNLEARPDTMATIALGADVSAPLGWMLSAKSANQLDALLLARPAGECKVDLWSTLGYEFIPAAGTSPISNNGCVFDLLEDQVNLDGFHLERKGKLR